jgi:NADH-quinone oxidoreductase subunit C
MFGLVFDGHPHPAPLLLPDGFAGHPLRKDFVLASRVAKEWPGAKEPGESHTGATRRRMRPPGVPDDWGPATEPAPDRPARRDRPGRPGVAAPGGATRADRLAPTRAAGAADAAAAEAPPEPGPPEARDE